jgi:hypothetical protein
MKIEGLPVVDVDESEKVTVAVRADDLLEGDTADPERHPIAIALRRQDDVDDARVTKNATLIRRGKQWFNLLFARMGTQPVHWSVRCVHQQTPAPLKLTQTVFLGCWAVAKSFHHRVEQHFRDWARGVIEIQARLRRPCA